MIILLLILTTVGVLGSMGYAYARSRDPLHPLMYLGPMLIYIYVVRPAMLLANGDLQRFLSDDQLLFSQMLFTAGIGLFCVGLLAAGQRGKGQIRFTVTPVMRRRMFDLACVLGTFSLVAYWFAVFQSGGFFEVYSRAKAYVSAGSGWIDEMTNFSIPAAGLLLLSWQGKRRYRHHLWLAILFASPVLIHGLLGARRGPTFLILATLLVAWYVSSEKRISLWKVTTRFGLIAAVLFFLIANRKQIYIGSDFNVSFDKFWEQVAPAEADPADDTVFMYGFVNGIHQTGTHYWGLRYAATYLIRPIPRQIWPTKYDDLGLGWMVHQSEYAGISDSHWKNVLGWVPVRGSAPGFIADWFLEFSWLGLIGCAAMGAFFGWLWKRATIGGGLWTLLYVQAAALSVYVPTQSVSAVFHRFLFMTVPTLLLWKFYIGRTDSPPTLYGPKRNGRSGRPRRSPIDANRRIRTLKSRVIVP